MAFTQLQRGMNSFEEAIPSAKKPKEILPAHAPCLGRSDGAGSMLASGSVSQVLVSNKMTAFAG
jgi:hypothetical protein